MPTITIPEPRVIGNHPANCTCATCKGARKRLLASPYVQTLRQMIENLGKEIEGLPERPTLGEAVPKIADLEARVIALTTRNQELENGNELLRQTIQLGEKATGNLKATILDRDREIKRLTDLQSRTADELGAALAENKEYAERLKLVAEELKATQAQEEKWRGDLAKLRDDHAALLRQSLEQESASNEQGEMLLAAHKALRELETERDGLAADLQRMTGEANKQRQAADGAKEALAAIRRDLEQATLTLNTKTYELACLKAEMERRLPVWAQVLAGLVIGSIIFAIAHRAGWEARGGLGR